MGSDGSDPLFLMKPCVDIEGSGEGATSITRSDFHPGGCTPTLHANHGVHAELRDLTIEHLGGACAVAISMVGSASANADLRMSRVTVVASNASFTTGITTSDAFSPLMKHVRVLATGSGSNTAISIDAGPSQWVSLDDVTATSSKGTGFAVWANVGGLTVYRSHLVGPVSLRVAFGGVPVRLADTQVEGPMQIPSPNVGCIGVYDGDFAPYTCP